MEIKKSKRTNIFFLIWLLAGLSLIINTSIVVILGKSLFTLKDANSRHLEVEGFFDKFLSGYKIQKVLILENLNKILDPTIIYKPQELEKLTGLISLVENAESHLFFLEHKTQLNNLKERVQDLNFEISSSYEWRDRFNPIIDNIKNEKTLSIVRSQLNKAHSLFVDLKGKEKLKQVKWIKQLKVSSNNDVSVDIFEQKLFKSNISLLQQAEHEVAELAIFVERLSAEQSYDYLANFKDNEIVQNIDRLRSITYKLEAASDDKELLNAIPSADDFAKLIFGQEYYWDSAHQSIFTSIDGLYDLRSNYLLLLQQRTDLIKYFEKQFMLVDSSMDIVTTLIKDHQSYLFAYQEATLLKIWTDITVMSLIFAVIFIIIVFNISYFIRRIQGQLISSKEKLEGILETTGDAIRVIDLDCNVVQINGAMEQLTGVSRQDSVGQKCYDLFTYGDCGTNECTINKILAGEKYIHKENIIKIKDGKDLPVDIIVTPLNINGKLAGVVGSYRDITQRKKNEEKIKKAYQELEKNEIALKEMIYDLQAAHEELKSAQSQLIQSEKLASIGQLAAGIAHEINNPIGFISNNISVLKTYMDNLVNYLNKLHSIKELIRNKSFDSIEKALEEAEELDQRLDINYILKDLGDLFRETSNGLVRIKNIVMDFKTFSRKDTGEKGFIDLNRTIDEILNIVNNQMKYTCEVVKEYGEIPLIECNAQQIGQVFMNLLVNSVQAIETRGIIKIKTYLKENENRVYFEFHDNGSGIAEDKIIKIFDPFYTTKPVGQGTGLGLSISHKIIKDHGGEIHVKSKVGEGTTFTIILPVNNKK